MLLWTQIQLGPRGTSLGILEPLPKKQKQRALAGMMKFACEVWNLMGRRIYINQSVTHTLF